jgi:ribose transport system substrate-binding protein
MKTRNFLASPIFALVIATVMMDSVDSQAGDPTTALATLQEKILSKGSHGEEPSPASSVSLTTEEFEKIRGLKAKAAIVMHYSGDWSSL